MLKHYLMQNLQTLACVAVLGFALLVHHLRQRHVDEPPTSHVGTTARDFGWLGLMGLSWLAQWLTNAGRDFVHDGSAHEHRPPGRNAQRHIW